MRLGSDVRDIEVLALFWVLEVYEGGEEEDHVSSFIHDWGTAV